MVEGNLAVKIDSFLNNVKFLLDVFHDRYVRGNHREYRGIKLRKIIQNRTVFALNLIFRSHQQSQSPFLPTYIVIALILSSYPSTDTYTHLYYSEYNIPNY